MNQLSIPEFAGLTDAARFERFVTFSSRMLPAILLFPTESIKQRRDRLLSGIDLYGEQIACCRKAQDVCTAIENELRIRRKFR